MKPKITTELLNHPVWSKAYPSRITAIERFWKWVDRRADDECWHWLGADNGVGYGTINIGGHQYVATRVSWVIANGEIEDDSLYVCHRCDNPPCVNPAHLFLDSNSGNIKDAVRKGRMKGIYERGNIPPTARLDAEKVKHLRDQFRLVSNDESIYQFARRVSPLYSVSTAAIREAIRGETWADVA